MYNCNCCDHTALNIRVTDGCDCGWGNNGTITVSTGNRHGNSYGYGCGCNNTWSAVNGTAWTSNRCGCGCGC